MGTQFPSVCPLNKINMNYKYMLVILVCIATLDARKKKKKKNKPKPPKNCFPLPGDHSNHDHAPGTRLPVTKNPLGNYYLDYKSGAFDREWLPSDSFPLPCFVAECQADGYWHYVDVPCKACAVVGTPPDPPLTTYPLGNVKMNQDQVPPCYEEVCREWAGVVQFVKMGHRCHPKSAAATGGPTLAPVVPKTNPAGGGGSVTTTVASTKTS